jgi:hypothetical protein
MRHERTQPGNPHKLTINQHVFPAASIARFAQKDGFVTVYLYEQRKTVRLSPKNELFCAKRVWNQASEHGFMSEVEEAFQELANKILGGAFGLSIGATENRIVSQFYALCRLRDEAKKTPPPDAKMKSVSPEYTLTKNEEETLENNGYIFARGTTMPSRHMASIRIQVLLDILCVPETTWAVVYSREIEFIAPDSFCEIGIVPLSKNYCLVANQEGGEISSDNAIEINRIAIDKSFTYYFAHDFAKCGV